MLALRVRKLASVGAYPGGTSLVIPLLVGPWVSTSIYHVPLLSMHRSGQMAVQRHASRLVGQHLVLRLINFNT